MAVLLATVLCLLAVAVEGGKGMTERDDLERCCGRPTGCGVRKLCCIQLCALVEGDTEFAQAGCCPAQDPCGEKLESGSHHCYSRLVQTNKN